MNNLYWHTVTPLLKETLLALMQSPVFEQFRLVGGTALSLQRGHRMSIDIDLFTDAEYNSIDFSKIENFLKTNFSYYQTSNIPVGIGKSYFIGKDEKHAVKLDLYYTDKFMHDAINTEKIGWLI